MPDSSAGQLSKPNAGHGLYPRSEKNQILAQALNPRRLHLILFVTEQCNYRCVYCYESFTRGRMTAATVEGVKNLIKERSGDIDLLEIGWFGGEPLAAFDVIKEISDFVRQCQNDGAQFAFLGNMSTNAHQLSSERLHYLVETGSSIFQITLDGEKEYHDKARVTKAGKGTFNVVWSRLLEMAASDLDFEVIIRVHLNPENIDSVKVLQIDLEDTFGSDERFKFHYIFLENYGINASADVKVISQVEQRTIIEGLRKLHAREGSCFNFLTNCYVCYAAFANSFAIRSDGKVVKCTMAVDDSRNIIGRLHQDGKMEVDPSTMRSFLTGLETLDEETLACPWGSIAAQ